jgi:hypothetical protein
MTDTVLFDELLARYVTSSRWFRKQDQTVKQDAFIPPEDPLELSVTRHLNLSDDEIWNIGAGVATGQNRTLHGRADVKVAHVESQSLSVIADPAPNNPNHANICGWPAQKDLRKMRALEIARRAQFVANHAL